MATLRELIIKISANSSSFQSEIARASRMGADYYRTMEQGGRKAAAAARESQRAIQDLSEQLVATKETALEMTGVFAGAFAAGHLIELADNWNAVNARLKQASQSTGEFSTVQKALMDISQRTGTVFGDNANLYARSAASMREFGYSAQDVLKVTEAVSTGLKLSGASSEESSSVITQFSQALAQGVLRGEEFNAVNEAGDRVIRALAAGMGVARKDLKAMADQGQLTIDKVVPALTSQLDKLRGEFSSLPDSVSGSVTKVQNAFEQWVGEANSASGATATLSGALVGASKNIDTIATVTGALVAIGAARFFGGMASGALSASTGIFTAYKSEVALTQAQIRGTQISTARARAAVYRAQQALVAARGTTTQEAAERRLAAAQLALTRNMSARTAAQERLNNITSVGSRALSGALGLVGGIPGLVMLGAGAWYTMYQRQEQARESARAYIETLNDVRKAAKTMSLPEADDSRGKTVEALQEQGRLISERQEKVARLRDQLEKLNSTRGQPGLTSENDNNIVKAASILTSQLTVEEEKLNQMRARSQTIQDALAEIERRRNDLIKEQAWRQNAEYQSLLMMNGQHTEFNRLLSLGNQLLSARSSLANAPFRIPAAQLTTKQSDLLQRSEREKELAGLSGAAKVRRQAEYNADDAGLTDAPEYVENRNKFIKNTVDAWQKQEVLNKSLKDRRKALGEQNKEAREAAQLAENYSRKMADLSVAIEVQKVRATDGDKASELYAASHQAGTKWTEEQRKAIRDSSTELAKWTQLADANVKKQRDQVEALKDLSEAARKYRDDAALTTNTAGMSDRQRSRYDDQQQVERVFDKTDKGSAAIAARQQALDNLDKKYQAIAASESNWLNGVSRGYENWLESASNISGAVSSGITSTLDSAMDNMSAMLVGSKADWKSWGLSVLQTISKVALQMAVVNAMGGASSSFGSILGSVFSSVGGAAAGAAGGSTGAMGMPTSYAAYDDGGYTGPGGKHDPAGIVHKGEFVFTKEATQRIGVANLYDMMRGYANGGIVDGTAGTIAFSSGVNSVSGSNLGTININASVNINQSDAAGELNSGNTKNTAKQLEGIIQQTLTDRLKKEMVPGGLLYKS
ncbi:phage tail tape measure protein [Pantoea piersonii]|uniref:phage tail tape measure protein n=1 Tax=Pantoea piersonii TaxID=2364647 RepID=UPI00289B580B|nr:phage tail tape measure protein [Pantoea piersonii]